MEPYMVNSYGRKMQSILRQLLLSQGTMAHLKTNAIFRDGVLTLNIQTDPRAVRFLFPKIGTKHGKS